MTDGLRRGVELLTLTTLARTLYPLLLELATESRLASDIVEYLDAGRLLADERRMRSCSEIREGPGRGGRGKDGGLEGGGLGCVG